MGRKPIDGLTLIFSGVILLLLVGAGWSFWQYMAVTDQEPTKAPTVPEVSASPEPLLTQREDFKPDRSKLFAKYDAELTYTQGELTYTQGELTYTQGERVRLSDFRGKPVVLFFWSSWCGDCKGYFTQGLNEAVQAAEQSGAVFLMVCREGVRGESAQTAWACLAQYHIERDALMDQDAALFQQLGLRSVPSMAFISPAGTLMVTTNELLDAAGMRARVLYAAGQAAEQTEAFITGKLMDLSGTIASSYALNRRGELSTKDVQLAETQGLMMEYALTKGDQTLFDQAFAFVQSELTYDGLCAWKREDGTVQPVNATLDDLRIVNALLLAQARWGGYAQEIALRERALWDAVVQEDVLLDFIEFDQNARAQETTLCYLDIQALDNLARYQGRWQAVRDKAAALLENGLISGQFPLYYPRYDASLDTYPSATLQMNEAMVSVLHAVRAGVIQQRTLNYLESMLEDGAIYASYWVTGEPEPGYEYESTATYALLVQIGVASGRDTITRLALTRMEAHRKFDEPLIGGYGMMTDSVHHTFDDLQALLAWACI